MKALTKTAAAAVLLVALAGCTQAPAGQSPTEASSTPSSDASAGASTDGSAEPTGEVTTDEITIYVVRHGRTMLNTTDRVQGWSDAVLTPEGEEVVEAAGRGLADVEFQSAYSSDSGRAIQTAEIILAANGASGDLALVHDPRLREFNFGTWEGDLNHTMWQAIADDQGVTLEEFQATFTPEVFANSVAKLDAQNPEAAKNWPAEDYATIEARLSEALDEIVATETAKGNGNVLLVSHGLSISALFDMLIEDYEGPQGGLKNASVSILRYADGEYTLESLNDVSYIEAGQG
ncbi:putative phosphoglycerate mutase [Salana multivorans]|uniref:Putative phosphoglycerate mutase n=1 Tax=Salana multivorans TaxID=120377 RepID=A0A3N2D8A1_9MICO|nr:histidine phosphatase family protein [Salana multivorans]OJX93958.1 MAG: hypothetical protein BGO96_00405 [Micrococcales bacterium 73-15]ROR96007.1 putative phosphoglycerate mutase [Salana multivorans]